MGRLDLDTSGLLLLSNDTQFAERLTNPDHKVPKTYLLKCADLLTDETLEKLRRGVELTDGPTRPAEVRRVRDSGKYSHIEIRITEGRNRQVRRMVEAVGSKVLKLVRTAIGHIEIGELKIGTWRELTPVELARLCGQGIKKSPKRVSHSEWKARSSTRSPFSAYINTPPPGGRSGATTSRPAGTVATPPKPPRRPPDGTTCGGGCGPRSPSSSGVRFSDCSMPLRSRVSKRSATTQRGSGVMNCSRRRMRP